MNSNPMHHHDSPVESMSSQIRLGEFWSVALVLVLEIVIVGMVGFAPGIAHEAAHDVRHTFVFPCH